MNGRIHWMTKQEGGRSKPPAGVGQPPYATIVRSTDTSDPWPPPVAWSLAVEKIWDASNEYNWIANVRFLVDDAPASELRANRKFELFEGNKRVALGRTFEKSDAGFS